MFFEHYFLTSTVTSIRFAKQLKRLSEESDIPGLEKFINSTSKAIDVHNMREHSDQYFTGTGRKQVEFHKGSTDNVRCDMSSTIVSNDGHKLGSHVSIESIIASSKDAIGQRRLPLHCSGSSGLRPKISQNSNISPKQLCVNGT